MKRTFTLLATRHSAAGFTLLEMIVVIVITGIIGGMVAMFLRTPVQQYMDVARRAEMTDIADTALRRLSRDLRLALPNSVRVTNNGGTVYLEYLETIGGGRYNLGTLPADCLNSGNCTRLITLGNLVNGAAGTASLTMPNGNIIPATARVVLYNQYSNAGADCSSVNPSVYCAAASGGAPFVGSVVNGANVAQDQINFAAHTFLPAGGSPQNRFLLISQPVTYACTPGGALAGTLIRYRGYAMQAVQPTDLATLTNLNAGAVLAGNIGAACNFTYQNNVVSQRAGLVTANLSITRDGETVTLYHATHVENQP